MTFDEWMKFRTRLGHGETPAEVVSHIRSGRPGFGGGYGRGWDGEGAGWYDEAIYPGDTYPCLHRDWFGRLKGGVLAGPGWRKYETDEEADEDAIKAAPTGSASGPVGG